MSNEPAARWYIYLPRRPGEKPGLNPLSFGPFKSAADARAAAADMKREAARNGEDPFPEGYRVDSEG